MITGFELGKFKHSQLGIVEVTVQCVLLQGFSFDTTSMFVEHDGDILEVSRACVQEIN